MEQYLKIAKPGDLVVVVLILIITAGIYVSFGIQPAHGEGDLVIEVRVAGDLVYSEPLRSDEAPYTVTISVPRDGEAVLAVTENSVRVLPMPDELCPNHICSHVFGEISSPGQNIVCVPNLMVVELAGSGEPDLDGVTR